jgi:hypothetical protein
MAIYGPVRHQKNISFGPYNIFLVTDRSIYCHMTLKTSLSSEYIYTYLCTYQNKGTNIIPFLTQVFVARNYHPSPFFLNFLFTYLFSHFVCWFLFLFIWSWYICLYYTLRFYFPYVSLLAQPVNITLYGPGLECLVFIYWYYNTLN